MRGAALAFIMMAGGTAVAQPAAISPESAAAMRGLEAAWKAGDAEAWGERFWPDSRFVNIGGRPMDHAANVANHARIWAAHYKGTELRLTIVSDRALGDNNRLVEAEAALSGVKARAGGAPPPPDGIIPTRFVHVLERRGGEWRILFAQNTEVRPPAAPAPR